MLKPATTANRAPRGTKPVSQAFFTALDAIPDASRSAVGKAALAMIRDEMKNRRDKTKAAAAKEKEKARMTIGAPAKTPAKAAPAKPAGKAAAATRMSAKDAATIDAPAKRGPSKRAAAAAAVADAPPAPEPSPPHASSNGTAPPKRRGRKQAADAPDAE